MAAATTTTVSSTLAVVLLCAASLVGTGAAAAAGGGGGDHLEANKAYYDLVARTCASVTRRHYRGPGLTRQFCEWTLRSDRRSAAARDARDLALVAMDLVRSAAVSAETKVDGALSYGSTARWSKGTMLRLHYCQHDQNGVAHTVQACRRLVQEYDPRFRHGQRHNLIPSSEYLECAGRLVHDADDCWVHMEDQDRQAKKAVWKEVVEVASRANLAKAMVEQMVGVLGDDHHY